MSNSKCRVNDVFNNKKQLKTWQSKSSAKISSYWKERSMARWQTKKSIDPIYREWSSRLPPSFNIDHPHGNDDEINKNNEVSQMSDKLFFLNWWY